MTSRLGHVNPLGPVWGCDDWKSEPRLREPVVCSRDFTIAPLFLRAPVVETTCLPSRDSRRSRLLSDPGKAIPIGVDLTAPISTGRIITHLHPFIIDSSPVHSLGLDAPDQAHLGSPTRDVSPRLCYPPRKAPRRSEAYRCWCAAPLSTVYPPTTSESSSGDSSERPMHSSPFCRTIAFKIHTHQRLHKEKPRLDIMLGLTTGNARLTAEEYELTLSTGWYAEAGIDPMTGSNVLFHLNYIPFLSTLEVGKRCLLSHVGHFVTSKHYSKIKVQWLIREN
ncbi:hypothetical protein Tco_0199427 [Tanacetum coccineum]